MANGHCSGARRQAAPIRSAHLRQEWPSLLGVLPIRPYGGLSLAGAASAWGLMARHAAGGAGVARRHGRNRHRGGGRSRIESAVPRNLADIGEGSPAEAGVASPRHAAALRRRAAVLGLAVLTPSRTYGGPPDRQPPRYDMIGDRAPARRPSTGRRDWLRTPSRSSGSCMTNQTAPQSAGPVAPGWHSVHGWPGRSGQRGCTTRATVPASPTHDGGCQGRTSRPPGRGAKRPGRWGALASEPAAVDTGAAPGRAGPARERRPPESPPVRTSLAWRPCVRWCRRCCEHR